MYKVIRTEKIINTCMYLNDSWPGVSMINNPGTFISFLENY